MAGRLIWLVSQAGGDLFWRLPRRMHEGGRAAKARCRALNNGKSSWQKTAGIRRNGYEGLNCCCVLMGARQWQQNQGRSEVNYMAKVRTNRKMMKADGLCFS